MAAVIASVLVFLIVLGMLTGLYFVVKALPAKEPRNKPLPQKRIPSQEQPNFHPTRQFNKEELTIWLRYLREQDLLTTGQKVKAEQYFRTITAAAEAEEHTAGFTSTQQEEALKLAQENRLTATTKVTRLLDQAKQEREQTYIKTLRVDKAYLNNDQP